MIQELESQFKPNNEAFGETSQQFQSQGIKETQKYSGDLMIKQPSGAVSTSATPQEQDVPQLSEENLVQYQQKKSKQHGFNCPFHPAQIGTYLIFGYNILTFYSIFLPQIVENPRPIQQALAGCLGIIFALITILVVKYTYQTTIVDPTDPTVYLERMAQVRGYNDVNFDINDYEYFCNVCRTHVLEGTKHCQACNRCVSQFDHHCPWLNNCIGGQNYSVFLKMLTWVTIYVTLQQGAGVITLHFGEHFQTLDQSEDKSIWIMIVVNMCINVPVLLFLLKLLVFHIYLRTQNITTYQYILRERERESNQKQQSKVILQKNKLEEFNPENMDEKFKQGKDMQVKDLSERNQFVNSNTIPENQLSEGSRDRDTVLYSVERREKCSLIRFLLNRLSGGQEAKQAQSIKVQPIGGPPLECGRGYQDEDIHLSKEDMEAQRGMSQLKNLHHDTITMNRGASQIKLDNNLLLDEFTRVDPMNQVLFLINHNNNKSELAGRQIYIHDNDQLNGRSSSKMLRAVNICVDDDDDSVQFARASNQGGISYLDGSDKKPQSEISRKQKTRSVNQHSATPNQKVKTQIGINSSIMQQVTITNNPLEHETINAYKNTNIKHVVTQHLQSLPRLSHAPGDLIGGGHQHSYDYSVRENEESRRTSRNQDRGPSEMQSVTSKNKLYEHKVLA